MAAKNPRGTRAYRQAVANLKAQGDAYCWRGCGTWLYANAPHGHPQAMTLGHIVAIEDGGHPTDPSNHAPECGPCNYRDGARRTNTRKARHTPTPQAYRYDAW